jgi:hypothetical protein
MTEHDLMAWLGPATAELTAEQIDLIQTLCRDIDERWPDPDEQPEREAALSAVVQYLLGDTTPETARRTLVEARRRWDEAKAASTWLGVAIVRERQRAGRRPEKAVVARDVGIDRMALLRALGER